MRVFCLFESPWGPAAGRSSKNTWTVPKGTALRRDSHATCHKGIFGVTVHPFVLRARWVMFFIPTNNMIGGGKREAVEHTDRHASPFNPCHADQKRGDFQTLMRELWEPTTPHLLRLTLIATFNHRLRRLSCLFSGRSYTRARNHSRQSARNFAR